MLHLKAVSKVNYYIKAKSPNIWGSGDRYFFFDTCSNLGHLSNFNLDVDFIGNLNTKIFALQLL